ncbi:MAG: hypothetical protein ACFB0Z_02410 [Candidatus Phaeomarinobacter sp.]
MDTGNIAYLALVGVGMVSFGVTLFVCSMIAADRSDPFGSSAD